MAIMQIPLQKKTDTNVLKRNSMIGDGLSYVGLVAFAIATVLNFAVYF